MSCLCIRFLHYSVYCFQDEFDSSSAALEHSIREVGSYVCLCVFYTEHQKAESDEVPTDEAAPPGHKLVGFLAHLHKHSKRAKTVTSRLVRSVRKATLSEPAVSFGAATSDGLAWVLMALLVTLYQRTL